MGRQGMVIATARGTMALNKYSLVPRRMLLWLQTRLCLPIMEAWFKKLKQIMLLTNRKGNQQMET